MVARTWLVLLVCIAGSVAAIPSRPYGQSWRRAEVVTTTSQRIQTGLTRWLTTRLDHFSADPRTFQQRYFVNATVHKLGGPVFMCVGGEGPPLEEDVVVSGGLHCALMVDLAVRHSALIVALEHRYYGKSQPFSDLSTANLRFLSSLHALQDIAEFHAHVQEEYLLPASTKWVTFGGSYPGMLAAWARSKFPHLFHAAVSSSSPVEAVLNMQGYNDVTASSFADGLVGGSLECLAAVQAGFKELGTAIITPSGRRQLETGFNVCGIASSPPILEDPRSRALMTEGAADPLIPQSNDPACTEPVCDIRRQCLLLTNETIGTPLQRLQELNLIARGGECLNANYFEMLDGLKDEALAQDRTDRVWFYQTCSEFAFYQTCDPGKSSVCVELHFIRCMRCRFHQNMRCRVDARLKGCRKRS
jgi:serine protease 16